MIQELLDNTTPLSPSAVEEVYAAAYNWYEMGDYEKAAGFFTHLTLHDPFSVRFWKGLASSRQMQKQYEAALRAWAIVCLLTNHEGSAHLHAAECYLSKGEKEEARKALKLAEEDETLKERIEEIRACLT